MATYFVSHEGDNGAGTSWATAKQPRAAGLALATTNGDIVKIDVGHTGDAELGSNTTYTFAANVSLICVDKDSSDALATMEETNWIGSSSANRTITLAGAFKIFLYGITIRNAGGLGANFSLTSTAGQQTIAESCKFWFSGTSGHTLNIGSGSPTIEQAVMLNNCKLKFNNAAQRISRRGSVNTQINGLTLEGVSPTSLILDETAAGSIDFVNCDLSTATGNLVGAMTSGGGKFTFSNCKLGIGVVPMATQTYSIISEADVTLYNCMSGDAHYGFAHYNPLGQTEVETGIYANDGAEYNTAAAKYSWKITTTASANFYNPYVSPWLHQYHEGTSAITPYLECLRDNSSGAVFQNDEVWGEFSYQGTSGFTIGTVVNDRMALLGSPADQTASSKGASDWTGETGTAGYFKINPTATITPAEIGNLSARVCVGEPSITVYVDPQIRT